MTESSARFEAIRAAAAKREHGTRARYIADKCRCLLCRAANSRYQVGRDRARREGDQRELVNAEEARRHIRSLSKQGIGYKLVAEAAKVSISGIQKILSGQRSRIRANTSRSILAVEPAVEILGDASLVDARPSWCILDELIERGYTKCQLAKWIGYTTPAIQFKRGGKITARSAFKIARLSEQLQAGKLKR